MARRANNSPLLVAVVAGAGLLFLVCCGGPCALIGIAPAPSQQPPAESASVQHVATLSEFPAESVQRDDSVAASAAEPELPRRTEPLPSYPVTPVVAEAVASQPEPELRAWTSSGGGHSTSATFVALVDDKVQMAKAGGSMVTVPLDKLAAADRLYVKELLRIDPRAKVILGKVTRVADGDTFTMLDEEKHAHTVRLEGIDSPEGDQEFGDEAKAALIEKLLNEYPRVEWREFDRYNRVVGHVYLSDRYINHELVAEGAAWHYTDYSSDPKLAHAESEARSGRLGLWRDSKPIAPWDYRNGERSPAAAPAAIPLIGRTPNPELPADPETQAVTVYVTDTGEKYHRAGCRYLRRSSNPISLSAARQGYSPCSVCDPP